MRGNGFYVRHVRFFPFSECQEEKKYQNSDFKLGILREKSDLKKIIYIFCKPTPTLFSSMPAVPGRHSHLCVTSGGNGEFAVRGNVSIKDSKKFMITTLL